MGLKVPVLGYTTRLFPSIFPETKNKVGANQINLITEINVVNNKRPTLLLTKVNWRFYCQAINSK